MKVVVITGSTRGIGFALADAFLALGCAITINGRDQETVNSVVDGLSRKYEPARVLGYAGDVADFEQVQSLWNAAKVHFGKIDIWINNAGIANPLDNCWNFTPKQIKNIVDTNLLGAMYGSVVAARGMQEQGFGSLYNMEGYGSDGGRMVKGLALYGATKAALRFFDDALMQEANGKPFLVGALRPGMVATDMLSSQYIGKPEEWERAKNIFNILADRPETVAPWLAKQILENQKTGARISWTSRIKVLGRFLMAPFRKRQVFD